MIAETEFAFVAEPTKHRYPDGFFRVFLTTGEERGLGFSCHKCHLTISGNLRPGQRLFHCGKSVVVPEPPRTFWQMLRRGWLPKITRRRLAIA